MNSIVLVTICAMFITFSKASVIPGSPRNPSRGPFLEFINDACMYMAYANYSVQGMGLDSPPISGCVYLDGEDEAKTFTLWFGNSPRSDRQQCGTEATSTDDYTGMEQITFPCLEFPKSSLENTEDGTEYLRLYGINDYKHGVRRCALFEKDEFGSQVFRLAVSKDHSCDGLARILTLTFPKIPKGSKLLLLTRESIHQKYQSRYGRSTTNSTFTIQNQN